MAARRSLAAIHNLSHLILMYVFRKNYRGIIAPWRRYDLIVDDKRHGRIADGELVSIDDGRHTISVSAGKMHSKKTKVDGTADTVVLCERVPATNKGRPAIKLTVTDVDKVQDSLFRFDRPPYVGGTRIAWGYSIAVTAGVFMLGIAASIWVATEAAGKPLLVSLIIFAPCGIVLGGLPIGIATIGIRNFYYYFRLPRDWRH